MARGFVNAIIVSAPIWALIILAVIVLTACDRAHAGKYWFKTAEATPNVRVVYVDKVECGEEPDALGCYRAIWAGHSGIITIKRGMNDYLTQCTLAHEKKHAEGYRHQKYGFGFIDCGNGSWISAKTYARMR